ncbi:hypothetical protein T492DRAFT_958705, partial [Pavlovales sp. CCMP2436]
MRAGVLETHVGACAGKVNGITAGAGAIRKEPLAKPASPRLCADGEPCAIHRREPRSVLAGVDLRLRGEKLEEAHFFPELWQLRAHSLWAVGARCEGGEQGDLASCRRESRLREQAHLLGGPPHLRRRVAELLYKVLEGTLFDIEARPRHSHRRAARCGSGPLPRVPLDSARLDGTREEARLDHARVRRNAMNDGGGFRRAARGEEEEGSSLVLRDHLNDQLGAGGAGARRELLQRGRGRGDEGLPGCVLQTVGRAQDCRLDKRGRLGPETEQLAEHDLDAMS